MRIHIWLLAALLGLLLAQSIGLAQGRPRSVPPGETLDILDTDVEFWVDDLLDENYTSIVDGFIYVAIFSDILEYAQTDDDRADWVDDAISIYNLFPSGLQYQVLELFAPFSDLVAVQNLMLAEFQSTDEYARAHASKVYLIWGDSKKALEGLIATNFFAAFTEYPNEELRDTLEYYASNGTWLQKFYSAQALEKLSDKNTIVSVTRDILNNAPVVSPDRYTAAAKHMAMLTTARLEIPNMYSVLARQTEDETRLVMYTAIDLLIAMHNAGESQATAQLQLISSTHPLMEIRRQAQDALEQ